MTPEELQTSPLNLIHKFVKINNVSETTSFYTGPIDKLNDVKEPCFVLFSKLLQESKTGEEKVFEYITVKYFNNSCNYDIPDDATHFTLVEEPPISEEKAKVLQQRFSFPQSNYPLLIPVSDPFNNPTTSQ